MPTALMHNVDACVLLLQRGTAVMPTALMHSVDACVLLLQKGTAVMPTALMHSVDACVCVLVRSRAREKKASRAREKKAQRGWGGRRGRGRERGGGRGRGVWGVGGKERERYLKKYLSANAVEPFACARTQSWCILPPFVRSLSSRALSLHCSSLLFTRVRWQNIHARKQYV